MCLLSAPVPSRDTPVVFFSECTVPGTRPGQEASQRLYNVSPVPRPFPLQRLKYLPQSQLPGSPVQPCAWQTLPHLTLVPDCGGRKRHPRFSAEGPKAH